MKGNKKIFLTHSAKAKQQSEREVDIILALLLEAKEAAPGSPFIASLLAQYRERGSLSKKQLEGLHSKSSTLSSIKPSLLASLEAILIKMPNRYKSEKPLPKPILEKSEPVEKWISSILNLYPQHKRVFYYKMKLERNETFSPAEITELEKFYKLLVK